MGMLSLLFVILVTGAHVVVGQQPFHISRNAVLSVDILPSLPVSLSDPTAVITVDCLFCSSTDDAEVVSVTVEDVSAVTETWTIVTPIATGVVSGEASGTIICAEHCQTLVTVPWKSGESKIAPLTPVPISTSCITIFNTPVPPIPIPTSDIWSLTVPSPSLSTSTSCSTTSTELSPWTWQPETSTLTTISTSTYLASSVLGIPSWTSAATEEATSVFLTTVRDTTVYPSGTKITGWSLVSIQTSPATEIPTSTPTGEAPVSEPCTTEITVTMTKTFFETWESKTPQTTTLLRTISTTIETVIVEAYSTSTGEVVVEGTETETTTVEAVSSGVDCSEVGKCCAGCSVTFESVGVETSSSTLVGTYTTVEEYVSSAGGSWVPAESPSGTAVVSGTDGSTPTASETVTEATGASGSYTEPETTGPTSVQTAGAAHVTAAVGIGAIFGLMGLLA